MPLSDIFAALRWWAVLTVLGMAATPLTFYLLGRLPDRGYAFSKMLGVLVTSYLFWLMGSFGFAGNNLGGILLAVTIMVGLSLWAASRSSLDGPGVRGWLRVNGRYVLITELVFVAIFALWVWVRSQNPAIDATEKPMEFAFLNAVGRSPTFPPLDPWLSGYSISYYYFGYVMTSVIARLAVVAEPVAFNLGIAWLVAGSAVGAFGLVYNLVANQDKETPAKPGASSWSRRAILFGLVAAVALPIAGNMEILLEELHGNNVGSAEFWLWLDVRDLNGPASSSPRFDSPGWWWWRSSRVIHEYHLWGDSEEGLEPIAEFPGFSFILGDMHPHVLALPFAFLSLAVAFAWWLRPGGIKTGTQGNLPSQGRWRELRGTQEEDKEVGGTQESGVPAQNSVLADVWLLLKQVGISRWLLTALVLGGLSFLNTWDVLIHLFVVVAAFVLGQWRESGRWHSRLLLQGLVMGFLLVVPAVLLYLPFYLGFRSQAGAPYLLPMLMRPTRLTHYLVIFAMPMWSILILLGSQLLIRRTEGNLPLQGQWRELKRPAWKVGLTIFVGLIGGLFLVMILFGWVVASSPDGVGRVSQIAGELNLTLPAQPETFADRLRWGMAAVVTLLPTIVNARLALPGLTLLLAAIIAVVVMAWAGRLDRVEVATTKMGTARWPESLPFVLLLVATGALLTLGPEFVYLRDNFGVRLNTVFKFYYQAWVMFGVAALFGLDYLLRRNRPAGVIASVGYGAMLAVALLFPIRAVASRAVEFRGPAETAERQPPTLNGLVQVSRFNPAEYDALMWLRQNVPGAPVVLEAVGGQYSGYGRVSASTGLPTLLGWAGHEYQWRGTTPEPGEREPLVRTIYDEPDLALVAPTLNRYGVEYIFVGSLEQRDFNPAGLEKFGQQLEVAYSNGGVTIYRWQPQ